MTDFTENTDSVARGTEDGAHEFTREAGSTDFASEFGHDNVGDFTSGIIHDHQFADNLSRQSNPPHPPSPDSKKLNGENNNKKDFVDISDEIPIGRFADTSRRAKTAAKAGIGGFITNTLDDALGGDGDEVGNATSKAYSAKKAYRVVRHGGSKLSGSTGASVTGDIASDGSKVEKVGQRSARNSTQVPNKRLRQIQSKIASVARTAGTTAKVAAQRLVAKIAGAKIGIPVAIATLLVLSIALMPVLFTSCVATMFGGQKEAGSLKGNEAIVAKFLKEKGLDDIHAAAVMGNMRAESGGECGTDFNSGAVEEGNGIGHGICQWSYERWNGDGGLSAFADSQNKLWTDLTVQLDFFWLEFNGPWNGNYSTSDPVMHVTGSKGGFDSTTDVAEATRQMCYGWERPSIPHEDRRIAHARWYLSALQSGGKGQDYAASSEEQKAIVDSCYATNFVGDGLCASWVSKAFQNAGWSYPTGNANDMWAAHCHSSKQDELKVGMMVAVQHSGRSGDSWNYGHIGIYIGDGRVMHNESSSTGNASNGCTITPLNEWIAYYDPYNTVAWGFPPK
ncbi:MAG: phage tail tip lysozyme [Raoultibacter sp.]